MLRWFDENPDRYWWLVCVVIAAALFAILRPLRRSTWRNERGTDWRWSLVIAGVLLAGRWPTWLVTRQLNPDESQLIAGALTLRADPVFWRSVDGATAGPLDFYALWPAGWLLGADDFRSARVTAWGLLALALIFAHQTTAIVFGRIVARVTGFSALCLEALTLNPDFLHYSTELVPICLLAAAMFLLCRRFFADASWRWNALGGLILGAVPLAKLQAAPIAVLLAAGWAAGELWFGSCRRDERPKALLALGAGGGATFLAFALMLTWTGQWRNAVIPYILYNLGYAQAGYFSWPAIFARLWIDSSAHESLLPWWLAGATLASLCLLAFPRTHDRGGRAATAIVVVFLGASLGCILLPHRPYLHYWQFLVVPGVLVLGALTGSVAQEFANRRPALCTGVFCAVLALSAGGLLYVRAGDTQPDVGRLALYQTHPRSRVALELLKYARPGETLGIWGWTTNQYYVETGLRQATRNAHSLSMILASPYYDFFRQRYLADLKHSAAPVFIDAMNPDPTSSDYVFHHGLLRHEVIFPELARYISAHYEQIGELQGVQIFVRNDRLAVTAR